MKTIKTLTVRSKKTVKGKYVVQKEHITYDDNSTADVVRYYSLDGKLLGNRESAEKYVSELQMRVSLVKPRKASK